MATSSASRRAMANRGELPDPARAPRAQDVGPLIAALVSLFLLVAWLFSPAAKFGFLSFDDPAYVAANPRVLTGLTWDNARWAITTFHAMLWIPVTWISLMVDASILGTSPAGFHGVNVVLHATNAVLLAVLLFTATKDAAAAVVAGALFAMHPLRVESVAWVTERKDVLSMVLLLLSLVAYVVRSRRGGVLPYALSLGGYAAALMAKPTAVTVPILLLLLDLWPLRRREPWRVLLVEKLPYLALAGVDAALTLRAAHTGGAVASVAIVPVYDRVAGAIASYAWYPLKMLWPTDLAFYYPRQDAPGLPATLATAGALVAATYGCLRAWPARPYLTIGWLWYVVALLPMSGLLQAGDQARADRFTYLPGIGLTVAASFAIATTVRGASVRVRPALAAAVAAALLALALLTRSQLATWAGDESVARQALAVTTGNTRAHFLLASALAERGDLDGAILQYRAAINAPRPLAEAHAGLGLLLARRGDPSGAIAAYEQALRLSPNDAITHFNLGLALLSSNRPPDATQQFEAAVRLQPDYPAAQYRLGMAYAATGDLGAALPHLQHAVTLAPGSPDARIALGNALFMAGRGPEAVAVYREAVGLAPNDAELQHNFGVALATTGNPDGAIRAFEAAIGLRPTYAEAEYHLAFTLEGLGRLSEARDHYLRARQYQPDLRDVAARLEAINRKVRQGSPEASAVQ